MLAKYVLKYCRALHVLAGCLASVVETGLILFLEEKGSGAPEVEERRMSSDPTTPFQVAFLHLTRSNTRSSTPLQCCLGSAPQLNELRELMSAGLCLTQAKVQLRYRARD